MTNFKVGCSPITSRIFAGTVLKNGTWGKDKKDVTDSAPSAVAQHLMQLDELIEFTYKNETYQLRVDKVETINKETNSNNVKNSVPKKSIYFQAGTVVQSSRILVLVTGKGDVGAGYPCFAGVVVNSLSRGEDDDFWPVGTFSNTWNLEVFEKTDIDINKVMTDLSNTKKI